MSCCPAPPPIKTSDAPGYINGGHESDIKAGESVECYIKRAGNQSGKLDDATENPAGRIENTAIPINAADASVNITFRLTSTSTAVPTSWVLRKADGSTWSESGVIFSSAGATASLIGAFSNASQGKPFQIIITAYVGAAEIDSRSFAFSPKIVSKTSGISFVSPLPGGFINSKFGPRLHPITRVMKPHTGVDLKLPNQATTDVVAAADGTVVFAGVSGTLTAGYGNCVKIKHSNGSGLFLCTTIYGHMAKLYVTPGQIVSAGQKIGYEGSTGSSTGNHLHFEIRLPDNTAVDPAPYLANTPIADSTLANGDPAAPPTQNSNGSAAITKEGVIAQTSPCTPSGVDPKSGAVAATPPNAGAPTSGDPFEHAWYFTMTFEVGPWWMTSPQYSPGDPDIDAGRYETDLQRKKVGYKPGPNFPGGETKFGVAQNPNKSTVVVSSLTYLQAKSFAKSNYWSIGGTTNCVNKPPLVAIMLFDLNYLHGPGNARAILSKSGQANISSAASRAEQLEACAAIHSSSLEFLAGMNPTYVNGWINRANARFAFVKSISYPLS